MAQRVGDSLYPINGSPGFGADFRRNSPAILAAIDSMNAKRAEEDDDADEVVAEEAAGLSRHVGTSVPVAGRGRTRKVTPSEVAALEEALAPALAAAEARIEATRREPEPVPQMSAAGGNGGCCCPCHELESGFSDHRIPNLFREDRPSPPARNEYPTFNPFSYDFWVDVCKVDTNQIAFHTFGALGFATATGACVWVWLRVFGLH